MLPMRDVKYKMSPRPNVPICLKYANLKSYYQVLLVSLPSSQLDHVFACCDYDYDLNVNTKYTYLQNSKILQSTPRVTRISITIILIYTLDVFTRHEKKGAATIAQ